MVQCIKLKQELPGLDEAPMPGELGRRIYEQVSQDAWGQWISHSTMVINEYRLNPSEPDAQEILRQQLEKFLFEGEAAPPPDYVPE